MRRKRMSYFLASRFFASLLLCFFQLYCWADERPAGEEITGGFRFASPGFKDGYRWKVEGDRARFISPEVIEISPVRAIVSSEKESEYVIKMDWAQLHRPTKDVRSDSPIEIIKGNSKMTGIGLRWYTSRKLIRILKNVKMTLDLGDSKQWQFK